MYLVLGIIFFIIEALRCACHGDYSGLEVIGYVIMFFVILAIIAYCPILLFIICGITVLVLIACKN